MESYLEEARDFDRQEREIQPFLMSEVNPSTKDSDMAGQTLSKFIYRAFHHIDIATTSDLPTEQHYFLLTPMIGGFGVHDKEWKVFYSELLLEVKPQDAMNNLVIDPVNREIVEAIVYTQSQVALDKMDSKGEG